jgi:hypothetical protein
MKWVYWIGGSAILIVVSIAVVGWLLPVNHEASRSAEFGKPPDAVFALLSDLKNYPSWWPEGTVKVVVVENVPPVRFVTRIDEPDEPFGGTWTIEIAPTPSGSRVTVTERGEIYNPIFRALARFVFGYTGTMESFLAAAGRTVDAT